jgi:hypothetical protein
MGIFDWFKKINQIFLEDLKKWDTEEAEEVEESDEHPVTEAEESEEQWMEKWDGKQPLDEGTFTRKVAGEIRKIIAKTIVRTLEPPKGVGKIFNFAGDKATRKGGPTANKMLGLKGLQKPIINYAKKGRLSSSEENILRDELRKNAGALSWGAGAIVILILSIPAGSMLTMWFLPIVGEIVRMVYEKWGLEWFLLGWDEDEVNLRSLKQKVKKAASKNLNNPPKLPTHIGGIPLQNYPVKK